MDLEVVVVVGEVEAVEGLVVGEVVEVATAAEEEGEEVRMKIIILIMKKLPYYRKLMLNEINKNLGNSH